MSEDDLGDIESIPDNPDEAVRALCRSARFFHQLILRCADRHPDALIPILVEHRETFEIAETAIREWSDFLEIRD